MCVVQVQAIDMGQSLIKWSPAEHVCANECYQVLQNPLHVPWVGRRSETKIKYNITKATRFIPTDYKIGTNQLKSYFGCQ